MSDERKGFAASDPFRSPDEHPEELFFQAETHHLPLLCEVADQARAQVAAQLAAADELQRAAWWANAWANVPRLPGRLVPVRRLLSLTRLRHARAAYQRAKEAK